MFGSAGSRAADQGARTPTVQAAVLADEVRLARSRCLYLVLDPAAGTASLRRQNIELLEFAVTVSVSDAGRSGGHRLAWPALCFTLESELPEIERPRLSPPAQPGNSAAAPASPTVAELQAERERFLSLLPTNYKLLFAPDLEVTISGESGAVTARDRGRRVGRLLAATWHGLAAALTGNHNGEHNPRLQLLVLVTPAEARRLYLALEPDMSLLVVPSSSAE